MRFAATGRWSTRLRGLHLKRRVQFTLASGRNILPVILIVITTAEVAETIITPTEVAETFYAETLIIVAISPGIFVWFLECPPFFTHTH